jgi:hypothetical protein
MARLTRGVLHASTAVAMIFHGGGEAMQNKPKTHRELQPRQLAARAL